jgi:hypothetical protein
VHDLAQQVVQVHDGAPAPVALEGQEAQAGGQVLRVDVQPLTLPWGGCGREGGREGGGGQTHSNRDENRGMEILEAMCAAAGLQQPRLTLAWRGAETHPP